MAKSKVYGVTGKQAARLRRVCERVEGTPPNAPFGEGSNGRFWNPGLLRARVTTTIPAGTLASPSTTGKVQILELDESGAWVDDGNDPAQTHNQFGGGDIEVGSGVLVAWIAGSLFVVAADCPGGD